MNQNASQEYADEWEFFRSVSVLDNHKINLIDELRHLVFDDPLQGESVLWNYDRLEQAAVISNDSIGGGRYVEYGKSTYQMPSGHITPPAEIRKKVDGDMEIGNTVYLLASENMLKSKVASAFLLTAEQATRGIDIEPIEYVVS